MSDKSGWVYYLTIERHGHDLYRGSKNINFHYSPGFCGYSLKPVEEKKPKKVHNNQFQLLHAYFTHKKCIIIDLFVNVTKKKLKYAFLRSAVFLYTQIELALWVICEQSYSLRWILFMIKTSRHSYTYNVLQQQPNSPNRLKIEPNTTISYYDMA